MSVRVFGVCGDDPHLLREVLTAALGGAEAAEDPDLRVTYAPQDAPAFALAARSGCYPPVALARSADGSLLAVDGELYNLDSRSSAATRPRPEALLAAMNADAASALDRLDAAAFITHYNASTRSVTIARDAVGLATCYACAFDGGMAWASDLPTLLRVLPSSEIDEDALDCFLATGYIAAPMSIAKGVHRLEAGGAWTFAPGAGVRTTRYLRFSPYGAPQLTSAQVTDRLADIVPRSVSRRVTAIESTGVLLSGGVDSATMLAAAANEFGAAPKTFTFHYQGYEGIYNEAPAARRVAKHFGAEHHEIVFDPYTIPDRLDAMIGAFGAPFSYGLHSFALAEAARAGVKDLLCGTGIGLWFLGSDSAAAIRYAKLPYPLRLAVDAYVTAGQSTLSAARTAGASGRMKRLEPLLNRFSGARRSARTRLPASCADYIAPLWIRKTLHLDPSLAEQAAQRRRRLFTSLVADMEGLELHQIFRLVNSAYYGGDMMHHWNHWVGRAYGMMIRSPVCDREGAHFMLSQDPFAPGRVFQRGEYKSELRAYAARIMPHDMAYAGKIAQSVPLNEWLRGPLRDFVFDMLSPETVSRAGLFAPSAVSSLLESFYAKNDAPRMANWIIWTLIAALRWRALAKDRFGGPRQPAVLIASRAPARRL